MSLLHMLHVFSRYPAISTFLDSVKQGYGARFTAAFVAAGYEDLDDLKVDHPTAQHLASLLAETSSAKAPQIQRLMLGLNALTGGLERHTREATVASPPSHHTQQQEAGQPPEGITPHKYLMANRVNPAAVSGSSGSSVEAPRERDHDLRAAPPLAAAADPDRSHVLSREASTMVVRVAKPLLPNGKHAFLSYQWDVQVQVVQIKELLNERNIKCWMDIDGGMKADIYDSVSIL
jgi:hypothetical protein